MTIIIRLLLNALALVGIARIVPGIIINSPVTAVIAVLVFGLVNGILGTILKIITFPIAIITLGISGFFINAFFFWITSTLIHGFEVHSFSSAFIGALAVWCSTLLANILFKK